MRGVPEQAVTVLPDGGNPALTDYEFNAPAGANVSIEFCDDRWRPLAAVVAGVLAAGVNTNLTTLAGAIPAGATRARCYADADIYWNLSAVSVITPSVSLIPARSEFDLGVSDVDQEMPIRRRDPLEIVEAPWLSQDITGPNTVVVIVGPGEFGGLNILTAAAGHVHVYDGVDATGTLLTTFPAALVAGSYPGRPLAFGVGLCIVSDAATTVTVFYKAA